MSKDGIDRRNFLQRGLGAGALFLAPGAVAPVLAGEAAPAAPPAAPGDEWAFATIPELQKAMDEGRLTAVGLTEACLARIEALDRGGPRLNSVIEVNPEAVAIARALDEERRAKGPRGPLHGIPVLVKDNIDSADRMRTSAGSLALATSTAPRDAFVVERLRAAGAVLLGKTNLSEWANFRSTRSTSGWSGRGGQTRNPYATDRNPCGSSSGSAVAVAAGLVPVAVGTETDGSIVCPSHVNGIVGLKPTVGLVSRAGIIPISATQDTAGPMARTVTDAAILLGALAGADPRDAATARSRGKQPTDYTAGLDAQGLAGLRLGVVRTLWPAHPLVGKLMDGALAALKAAGAVLVDPVDVPHLGEYDDEELEVLLYEFKDGLAAYLATLGPNAPHRSLADLIRFNEQNAAREMPWFGQELFLEAEKRGPLTSPAYRKALATCRKLSRTEGLDVALKRYRLSAFVAPTGGPAWLTDPVNGDHFGGSSSTPAAVSGYPSITVPMGHVHGLPVGVSFFGGPWSEAALLRIAFAFERQAKAWKAPRFLPTLDLA